MKLADSLLASAVVLLLSACGGGGGGATTPGGNSPDSSTTPPVATFEFSPKFRKDQAGLLAPPVMSHAGRLMNYGQFAVDLTHRFVKAGGQLTVTAQCAFTGTIVLQLEDKDGNGQTSAGDVISANLDQCGVPILARKVSGKLRVEVLAINPDNGPSVEARLSIIDELKLSWMEDTSIGLMDLNASLRGSLKASWSQTTTGSRLRVRSSEADDWVSTADRDGASVTEGLRRIDVVKEVNTHTASVESSFAFLMDMGSLGGVIQVSTAEPVVGDLDSAPRKFVVNAGLAQYNLRIERGTQPLVYTGITSLQNRATGVVEQTSDFSPETVSLMRDERGGPWDRSLTIQGGGYHVFLPWQSSLFEDRIDRACAPRIDAGVRPYSKADALFQRPVVPAPSLTEEGATVYLQFGRTIANSNPTLQFRFVDTEALVDPKLPTWNIGTTSQRLGSSYVIRPSEPLRMGRHYALEASVDGSTWGRTFDIKDGSGDIVVSAPSSGSLTQIYTHQPIVASLAESDFFAADASAPAQLRGSSLVQAGLSIVRYQWEQLSGPPLRLSSPQSAQTLAYLDGNGVAEISPALLQLTVTDSQGHVDRARIRLQTGTRRSQGAAFVRQRGSDLRAMPKEAYVGEGSILMDTGGVISPGVIDADNGAGRSGFGFLVPVGAPLTVGNYTGAIRTFTPGSMPILISSALCLTEEAQSTGWFTIREIGFDANGNISRLAVDYGQRCNAGLHEYEYGSYRFNSSVPLAP